MEIALAIVLIILLISIALTIGLIRARRRVRKLDAEYHSEKQKREKLEERYAPVISIDDAVEAANQTKTKVETTISRLRKQYGEKKQVFDALRSEIALYDDAVTFMKYGLYQPTFNFDDSDEFKERIEGVRIRQKDMISEKTAVTAPDNFLLNDSKQEGRKMINRAVRLMLRAFNNECDAIIAKVRWNNANASKVRLERAQDAINKLNESLGMRISLEYYRLKKQELLLTHEYREKQKEEKDHAADMRRAQREEKQLERDAAKAADEEAKYQKLLDKAQKEAIGAVGDDLIAKEQEIQKLQDELTDAHSRMERAKSMAEQTRAGYIYVISNIGSFGNGVYKIGMTRRLEPDERVRELGDASVPFVFDTHTMFYCPDAPKVEKQLHQAFNANRVNMANNRKEFFRVPLSNIETEVHKIAPDADFVTDVEAQQYHETLAIMQQQTNVVQKHETVFPEEI